jgi:ribonuclease P protein component
MTEDAADDADVKVQVLVNVSKRRFKHAVDRNRVKRQIREAYRLNKEVLASAVPQGKRVLLAFLWLSDRHSPSATVAARVVSLLKRISKEL